MQLATCRPTAIIDKKSIQEQYKLYTHMLYHRKMAEQRRQDNGFTRSPSKISPVGSNNFARTASSKATNKQTIDQRQSSLDHKTTANTRKTTTIRRYYIDELGFYRHLDPDQRQYVCSNINGINLKSESDQQQHVEDGGHRFDASDSGYERCLKEIRHELRISHFDRTIGYQEWKLDWDIFMRDTLLKQVGVTLDSKLKRRVRSGIPHDYRSKMWSSMILMRTKRIRNQTGYNIYAVLRDQVSKIKVTDYENSTTTTRSSSYSIDTNNNLKSHHNGNKTIANQQSSKQAAYSRGQAKYTDQQQSNQIQMDYNIIDKCFRQIELDLLRTLPNNRNFEDTNSLGIQRVRRILRAYACFNQTVGYCQGMNRLAALALLVLPEEEAFWCLVAIIQCIMPKDYYLKPWLAQVDCCVLSDLIEKKMPKLHKHLQINDIQLTLFTWFFTIFVDGFRPELMLRIWDCFLLEGDEVLFRFALAILFIYQEDLLQMHDFSAISNHLSRLVSTRQLDVEHLFDGE